VNWEETVDFVSKQLGTPNRPPFEALWAWWELDDGDELAIGDAGCSVVVKVTGPTGCRRQMFRPDSDDATWYIRGVLAKAKQEPLEKKRVRALQAYLTENGVDAEPVRTEGGMCYFDVPVTPDGYIRVYSLSRTLFTAAVKSIYEHFEFEEQTKFLGWVKGVQDGLSADVV
jgi:hypothetical protein